MQTIGILLEWVLIFCIFLVFAVKSSAFQTWLAQQVASYLSDELGAEVRIERVDIDFFDYATLNGVFIGDQRGDTVLYTPAIHCEISYLSIREEKLSLSKAVLVDPHIELTKYEGDKVWNYDFLEEYFSSDKPKKKDTTKVPWDITCERILLSNAHFDYNNFNKPGQDFGIDFDHMAVRGMHAEFSNFYQVKDTSFLRIDRIFLHEQSGFQLDTLQADLKIHEQYLAFDQLLLRTPTTRITTPRLAFRFEDFKDFNWFEDKVDMYADLDLCEVDMDDISYFAPELKGFGRTIKIKSKVRGKVNDLHLKKLELIFGENTYLRGNVDMVGIEDPEIAFIDAKITEFGSNYSDITSIKLPPFDSSVYIEIPAWINYLGNFRGKASFTGTPNDFVAYGEANTEEGKVVADARFSLDTAEHYFKYAGQVRTENFNAGKVFEVSDLGNISLDLDVKASGFTEGDLVADIRGTIPSLSYMGYTYKNIAVPKGKFRSNKFDGEMKIKDENISLDFNGHVNFAERIPVFDFSMDVKNANLVKLNLAQRDSSSLLTVKIETDAKGNKLDNFSGDLILSDIQYHEKERDYYLDSLVLSARQNPDKTKTLVLDSDIASADVTGKYNFEELPAAFLSIISKVLPSLFDNKVIKLKNDQEFRYDVHIKDFGYVSELFMPEFSISKNVHLNGRFDSRQNIFRLRSDKIQEITYNNVMMQDVVLNAKNISDYLNVTVASSNIELSDSLHMKSFDFRGDLYQNKMVSVLMWNNGDSLNEGMLVTEGVVNKSNFFELDIMPSEIRLNGEQWKLQECSHLAVHGDTVYINEFNINNGPQVIALNGLISQVRNDKLSIDIQNFNLENLNPLIADSSMVLHGTLHGDGFVADLYNDLFFASNIRLDSFRLNEDYLGEFILVNRWDNENKIIHTNGELKRKEVRSVEFYGDFHTKREKENIDYVVEFNQTNLSFLNAFIPEDVSNLRGLATGKLTVNGTPAAPRVKGKMNFQNGAIKVEMLNTEYYFGGMVFMDEDMIAFDSIPIADLKGNLGYGRGTFYHDNFENWNFDCVLEFKKMLCLNTTEEMNSLYYGRAYATGNVQVFAYGNNIEIDVNVKSEKGTRIVLPLYGSSDQSIQDFVHFVSTDTTIAGDEKIDLTGITLNFDFDVTPDAEVMIVFDKLAGDMMKGRGAGHLQMLIDPLGQFNMFGQYVIDQGEYLFTLMNVINKRFSVRKGSTISWFGDPMAADIDLKAVYKVQAAPTEIMPPDLATMYKRNMDVECEMYLKENLFKPIPNFDIFIPKGDENVKSALSSIRASEQERQRQFFALLAINKFLPLSNSISNATSNAVSGGKSTVSELVSSQMSNWLSQISDEFDIGLNYRPGDEISSDEIAVAFSTQLFNDRLTVSTNLGVSKGNSSNQNPNQLIGDFNVEYKINDDGTFRVRGYNESNEFDVTRTAQAPFTQGVGVYYTEEFDKLSDLKFIRKIKSWFGRRKSKKQAEEGASSASTGSLFPEWDLILAMFSQK